jgi:ketosteroid isomerase-like protein
MSELTIGSVKTWLDGYKHAWEEQDSDALVALFSEDAHYIETPFQAPMIGRPAIRAYWEREVVADLKDIAFESRFWHLDSQVAMAHWQARFNWLRTRRPARLDGVFRLTFNGSANGIPLCRKLEEWWVLQHD